MSQTPSVAPPPLSITRNWIRNGALIGAVHFVAGLLLYLLRAVVPAEGDEVALLAGGYLLVIAIGLLAGAAEGVLSGAVLQRILPALPVRTWIALHALISAAVMVMVGPFSTSTRDATQDAMPILALALTAFLMGGILGALLAALEALVLRDVAFGLAQWIAYSALSSGVVYAAMTAFALSWNASGAADEPAQLVVAFALTVVQAVILLPALWQLRPRGRPQDVF
jgi:hypothetical protein